MIRSDGGPNPQSTPPRLARSVPLSPVTCHITTNSPQRQSNLPPPRVPQTATPSTPRPTSPTSTPSKPPSTSPTTATSPLTPPPATTSPFPLFPKTLFPPRPWWQRLHHRRPPAQPGRQARRDAPHADAGLCDGDFRRGGAVAG